MPIIKSGRWKVPSREGNPVIVESACCICGQHLEKPADRIYQMRATGINGSLQRWTFCVKDAPRQGPKIETSLVNRSMLVIDEW